ncbi:MAG: hypothetical protein AB7R55_19210 [Gemmatimonadales bacterium]
MPRVLVLIALLWSAGCGSAPSAPASFLFLWAADSTGATSDFLAVIDADPASPGYGQAVAALPTGESGSHPHHTEDVLAPSGHLLANGFGRGRTWLFDLSNPLEPAILTHFDDVSGLSHPHSFLRLADGKVLATFQYAAGGHRTGGLVLMDERGIPERSASAVDTTIPDERIYPYAVVPMPGIDRAISTTTDMDESNLAATSPWVQVWRLSDLSLLRTFSLEPGPRGDEHQLTGEPRLLADGRSVYVHTFNCGLYLIRGVDQPEPVARFVYGFEGKNCGVPVLTGSHWIQPVPEAHAVVALDLSDPEHPREVGRVTVDADEAPHWLAVDPKGRRLVMNSGGYARGNRLFVLDLDPATGSLTLDGRFKDPDDSRPGIDLDRRAWPHGLRGKAVPHGAVFSR